MILLGVTVKFVVDEKVFDKAESSMNKANSQVQQTQNEIEGILSEWNDIEDGISGGTQE